MSCIGSATDLTLRPNNGLKIGVPKRSVHGKQCPQGASKPCLPYDEFKFGTQCLAMHECCSMQYSSVSMCMEHDSIATLVQRLLLMLCATYIFGSQLASLSTCMYLARPVFAVVGNGQLQIALERSADRGIGSVVSTVALRRLQQDRFVLSLFVQGWSLQGPAGTHLSYMSAKGQLQEQNKVSDSTRIWARQTWNSSGSNAQGIIQYARGYSCLTGEGADIGYSHICMVAKLG